ncbi:MAG: AzlC family ABC transporter permease [Pseudomonadota bacterium]
MVREVFKTSLPVAFGYLPLGMAFGVLLQNLGIPWYWATAMGVFIFAGAAQFMAVAMLSAKAGLFDVFTATLLLNLRHVFYGLAMINRFKCLGSGRLYAIFGLTDETFSLLSTSEVQIGDSRFVVGLTALNHLWWVVGCTLGAVLKSNIEFDSTGIDFSLTCLFVVLLLEQWFKSRDPKPILAGLCAGAASLLVFGRDHFLLFGIAGVMLTIPLIGKDVKND